MSNLPTHAKIAAIGSSFPEKILSNADLEKMVDTSDAWITERTGIKERRILSEGENNSDFGAKAALQALERAKVDPKDVDLILYCTNTPDKILPATACIAQTKIGAVNSIAFDIMAACAGWVVGLSVAEQFVKTQKYKNVLVIGGEALTRFVNWEDRNTCVLFGDGAGAALITAAEENDTSRLLSTHMHTDGTLEDILDMPAGGSKTPSTPETTARFEHCITMRGKEVFKHAVQCMSNAALEACQANNMGIGDIDWFIPHQANMRIVNAVAKKLNFPHEKIVVNLHKYGNTSTATIPSALDEAVDEGKIKPGDIVLFDTFGGGLTWASAIVRW